MWCRGSLYMKDSTDSTTPLDVVADRPGSAEADQDLGRRMGRDARLVARGELSEETFYERYHEEVVEEFGEDRRPVGVDEA